jgi:hypothetical protein
MMFTTNVWQFVAWTTFTDGRLVGVDQAVTDDYLSVLGRFSTMSRASSPTGDPDFTNRYAPTSNECSLPLSCPQNKTCRPRGSHQRGDVGGTV